MANPKTKKLKLSRESLLALTPTELSTVGGGMRPKPRTYSCVLGGCDKTTSNQTVLC